MSTIIERSRALDRGLRVGDHVGLKLGARYVHGTIVEDRGQIGSGGRSLLLVAVKLGPESIEFEMPAEELVRFPSDNPEVQSAFEMLQDTVQCRKQVIAAPDDDDDTQVLRRLSESVKQDYRDLLKALRNTARPDTDLKALEASIPTAVKSSDAALGFLPGVSDV
jgi:hypothetical protein